MTQSVYVETTVISYLAARPSRDVIIKAHQEVTHAWWLKRRDDFELFVSDLVLEELSRGDKPAAARRLSYVRHLNSAPSTEPAIGLARLMLKQKAVPAVAQVDALHISIAAVHGADYLLTWNCRHIANAEMRVKIGAVCRNAGYEPPIICTPEELMGDSNA